MRTVMNRLKEASTWAGVAGMALAISPFLPPPFHICAQGVAAAAGALAAIMREGGQA